MKELIEQCLQQGVIDAAEDVGHEQVKIKRGRTHFIVKRRDAVDVLRTMLDRAAEDR